jgi:DNA-binding SARP family transcriptional activator
MALEPWGSGLRSSRGTADCHELDLPLAFADCRDGVQPLTTTAVTARSAPATRHTGPHLQLLNGFGLVCAGRPVSLPLGSQRLLAFMALHDQPLTRAHVAGVLWADSPEERAGASLRSALWRLRRPGHRLVDGTASHVRLSPTVAVDLRIGLARARAILAGGGHGLEPGQVDTLLHGELLPDWYDDWLVFERERFRQLALRALELQAEQRLVDGRLADALESALAVVHSEPLRESAHRLVIRIHMEDGNPAEALRQAEFCRRLFHERLHLEPTQKLDDLVAAITRSGPIAR